jgi:hypothetical protein
MLAISANFFDPRRLLLIGGDIFTENLFDARDDECESFSSSSASLSSSELAKYACCLLALRDLKLIEDVRETMPG